MKKLFITTLCLSLTAPLFADGTNQLADEKSRVSYALGLLNGQGWKTQDLDFDPDLYAQGIKDGLAGGPTLLTQEQAQQAMDAFRKEYNAKQQQKHAELLIKSKAEGEAFLATNKLTSGIKLLNVNQGGHVGEVQYLVLTNGTGPMPKATDSVSVNYRGTLLNGTEFDSSYKRGKPTSFPVGGVIPGWTAALEAMPVGSSWRLFIPADLAYGEHGNRGIPGNSVLIFDVDLLQIEPPVPPPAPMPVPAPLTSDIIKVPSADELKNGAKIEVIKPEDVEKAQQQQTNK